MFINSRILKTAWLTCVLSVLAVAVGCATSPKASKPVEEEIEIPEGELPPLVLIPNPYLQQKKKVPEKLANAFAAGTAQMQSANWPEAEMQFLNLTTQYPEYSGPWVNLGVCQWRQEKFDDAAASFEKAITVNSLNPDAYVLYGVMEREQGEFEKAEELYKKAIAVWPHNAIAHRNLGILYDMYRGQFDDALKHLEMSARIEGENASKELKGWIIDIKRRQAKMAREAAKAGEANE